MQLYYNEEEVEAGVDEVARGCLLGRVYTAAVIWNKENDPDVDHPVMKDSKKIPKLKRTQMSEYIKEYAIDYSIAYSEAELIDQKNILKTTHLTMHKALDQLNLDIDNILVDGNSFELYRNKNGEIIRHTCIVDGDTKYYPIACASILAKVAHDQYIVDLCLQYPELDQKYDLLSNMGYGTAKHIEGIKKFGLSPFHRKTFGICKNYSIKNNCNLVDEALIDDLDI